MSDIKFPDLPEGPEDLKLEDPDMSFKKGTPFIMNLYKDKDLLTESEAIHLMNHITGTILANVSNR